MSTDGMNYESTGVSYDDMDPFKRLAQHAAQTTSHNTERHHGLRVAEESRGESAFVVKDPVSGRVYAHVEEGLGTKNLIADAMEGVMEGKSYYDVVAIDTVAMIVNDMITLGVPPVSVAMHLAVGASEWFRNERRVETLIDGWRSACELAECVWAGGETPTLKNIVEPTSAVLSGSAFGMTTRDKLFDPSNIRDGDAIVLIESSGVHANGLTLCRQLADKLPSGYQTTIFDGGPTFGDALLMPTHIYVPLITECHNAGVDISYAINITGHGWRKLMRAPQPFCYSIYTLPERPPIFDFIEQQGGVTRREMYSTYNMGAGFALIVPRDQVEGVTDAVDRLTERYGDFPTAHHAGIVQKSPTRRVIIDPENIEFTEESLQVR